MSQEACPRCGKPYSPPAESCPACGVIFAKLRDSPHLPPPTAAVAASPQRPAFIQLRPPAPPAPRFSVLRSLLQAALLGVGIGVATASVIPYSRAIEQAWGLALIVLFALAKAVVIRAKARRLNPLEVGIFASVIALALGFFIFISWEAAPFSSAELRELARRSSRICNPAIGFSFPDPGPQLVANSEAQVRMSPTRKYDGVRGRHSWVFSASREVGSSLVVEVVKGSDATQTSLQTFAHGLRRFLIEQGGVVEDQSFLWVDGRYAYSLAINVPGRGRLSVRCLSSGNRWKPIIVCLQATGVTRESLQTVVEGLALGGCE